jgi:hypothetical protein
MAQFPADNNCPAPECKVTGSVPGLKRHFRKAHADLDFEKAFGEAPKPAKEPKVTTAKPPVSDAKPTAPAKQVSTGHEPSSKDQGLPLDQWKKAELQAEAKEAKITGWHKMDKPQLIQAIEMAQSLA